MIIDFKAIEEKILHEFKGGIGDVGMRMFTDENGKIMLGHLAPGASIGLHTHTSNYEVVYVVSGTATFLYEDGKEQCPAGCAHYCPPGCRHSLRNESNDEIVFFAIVPEK